MNSLVGQQEGQDALGELARVREYRQVHHASIKGLVFSGPAANSPAPGGFTAHPPPLRSGGLPDLSRRSRTPEDSA